MVHPRKPNENFFNFLWETVALEFFDQNGLAFITYKMFPPTLLDFTSRNTDDLSADKIAYSRQLNLKGTSPQLEDHPIQFPIISLTVPLPGPPRKNRSNLGAVKNPANPSEGLSSSRWNLQGRARGPSVVHATLRARVTGCSRLSRGQRLFCPLVKIVHGLMSHSFWILERTSGSLFPFESRTILGCNARLTRSCPRASFLFLLTG